MIEVPRAGVNAGERRAGNSFGFTQSLIVLSLRILDRQHIEYAESQENQCENAEHHRHPGWEQISQRVVFAAEAEQSAAPARIALPVKRIGMIVRRTNNGSAPPGNLRGADIAPAGAGRARSPVLCRASVHCALDSASAISCVAEISASVSTD